MSKKKKKAAPVAEPEKHVKDRELLNRVGTTLYGPRWQSELGRALNVNLRTTRRWVSGKSMIQPEFWEGMKKLLDRHSTKIGGVKDALDRKVDKVRVAA